ncbi:basic proline-rich protein-like [Felis catus]|uniref:basic proline-rich protein-like n=1 Tax=Felis catus TaxID=9685 RepID=UPI001D199A55|nr:basic proline-rich protein-like [Felis catus]
MEASTRSHFIRAGQAALREKAARGTEAGSADHPATPTPAAASTPPPASPDRRHADPAGPRPDPPGPHLPHPRLGCRHAPTGVPRGAQRGPDPAQLLPAHSAICARPARPGSASRSRHRAAQVVFTTAPPQPSGDGRPPPPPPPEAGPVPRSFSTQPRPPGWPAAAPGSTCGWRRPPRRAHGAAVTVAAPPRVSGLSTSPQEADGEREASAQSAPPACGTPSYQRGTQARLRPSCPMPVGPRRLPGYPPPLWTSTAGRSRRDPGYQPNPRGGRGSDSLEEHTLWPADDRRGRAGGSPLTLAYCPCCLTLRGGHLLHPATPPEVTP